MSSSTHRRSVRAVALAAVVALGGPITLSGCTQVVDAFNALQAQTSGGGQSVVVATPAPQSTASAMPFDSRFTYDGSVSLSSEVADGLELRLDVWAVDPTRTMEWTSTNAVTPLSQRWLRRATSAISTTSSAPGRSQWPPTMPEKAR